MTYRCLEESPAGLASFSLWVHGGKHCRPPISRMGNKAGYAHALGAIAGVRAGEGAGAYVWSESDADVRGLLRAYPDATVLLAIAEIIRGWKDEEPRALWERLRAERKTRIGAGGSVGGVEVAGWVLASMWSYEQGNVKTGFVGPGARRQDTSAAAAAACNNLAEYAQIAAANRLINVAGPDLRNTGKGGTTFGGAEFSTAPERVAEGFEEVAEWSYLHQGSFQYKGPEAGIGRPEGMEAHAGHGAVRPVAAILDDAFRRAPPGWPPVYVSPRILPAADLAAILGTPGDLGGVLCYSDPDYVGTTGYLDTYPRSAVVANAIDRARMGARVMVSEAEPVAELVALGWHATRIDFARKGQKRTFARVASEWVTSSFGPVDSYRATEQTTLFPVTR